VRGNNNLSYYCCRGFDDDGARLGLKRKLKSETRGDRGALHFPGQQERDIAKRKRLLGSRAWHRRGPVNSSLCDEAVSTWTRPPALPAPDIKAVAPNSRQN
jgi:hypothetical protein